MPEIDLAFDSGLILMHFSFSPALELCDSVATTKILHFGRSILSE